VGPTVQKLVDLQAAEDRRGVALESVGVAGVRVPVRITEMAAASHATVAEVRMAVGVPANTRGTHLSRFMELLAEHSGSLSLSEVGRLLSEIRRRQGARTADIEFAFDYFLRRGAPVSGAAGLLDYRCAYVGHDDGRKQRLVLRVEVPVATLCPCSKAISDAGAHNQRTNVRVDVRASGAIRIEEIVDWVEASGSCPLFPVLKRVDEKWVTEKAYATPRFVEDVVREVVVRIRDDARAVWCRVEARSLESIHNHDAFAAAEWARETPAQEAGR
jgi:GTP cyclohydrolase I